MGIVSKLGIRAEIFENSSLNLLILAQKWFAPISSLSKVEDSAAFLALSSSMMQQPLPLLWQAALE